jgi:Uma2 family endonuclease
VDEVETRAVVCKGTLIIDAFSNKPRERARLKPTFRVIVSGSASTAGTDIELENHSGHLDNEAAGHTSAEVHAMSTVTDAIIDIPSDISAQRLFTAADLAALPDQLPSGPANYELDEGRLIPMSPTGARHGSVQARLSAALCTQGDDLGHGRTFSETGIVMRRKPDTVYGPDLAFVVASRLPVKESREGYLEMMPDLVFEIKSKNDSAAYMRRKAQAYLRAGVRVVVLIDEGARQLTLLRPDTPPATISENETLVLDEIIPDFRLPLTQLFR